MVRDSHNETLSSAASTLAQALDGIEAALAALEPDASADIVADKLAGPARALGVAAKAAMNANPGGN